MPQLTIEDIATLAGVSRATVSRVLNDHPSVRPAVRDRVWQIINEQGYAPQAAARNLVNQRTHVIGVLFPRSENDHFTNPVFTSFGQGIGQVCAKRGYIAVLFLGLHEMEEHMLFTMLRSRHFDGIVLVGNDTNDQLPSMLKKAHIPYTRIGHDPDSDDLQWVDIDNVGGGYQAVAHLTSLGHRRVAFINGPPSEVCTPARYEGYRRALEEIGQPFDPTLVYEGDWSHISGYAATQQFLSLDQLPTAIFSANDMMAAGALSALHEHGLHVPTDMAVVGFDDFPQTSIITPALTTISQPSVEVGMCATKLLIDQLEGKDCQEAHIILPTRLIVRQSCGALAQHSAALSEKRKTSPSQVPSVPA